MKRLFLLALPALLAACTRPDPLTVLNRFDPAVTTVQVEAARMSALKAASRVAVQPGTYCYAFVDARTKDAVSGRIELTLRPGRTYQYADRYVFQGLVRARNEAGAYTVTGHGLTMVSGSGTERTLPLTSAGAGELRLWGATPLTREACTTPPVTGKALAAQLAAASAEQDRPVPWAAASSAPDLNTAP